MQTDFPACTYRGHGGKGVQRKVWAGEFSLLEYITQLSSEAWPCRLEGGWEWGQGTHQWPVCALVSNMAL
jgi:hypothetical protein